jgi:Rieske Fe-S protein
MFRYGRIPVLMIRTPEDELRIFVANCTHFDCPVGYKADENRIFCGCHNGYYRVDGQVISGPPPRPLRPFYWKIQDDKLILALEKENLDQASQESEA